MPTQAQLSPRAATPSPRPLNRSAIEITFDPPGDGEPEDTAGGASRDSGQCAQDARTLNSSITPLMPTTNHGLTVEEHPTFFVYIPPTSATKVFFSLKDKNEDYYYQATFPLPKTPGIISFKLPADAQALEIGKNYQWSLATICGETLDVDDPRVEGRIKRIEMNSVLSNQLENLSLLERAALYSSNGIWYDTLTILAQLRRSQPNDSTLAATWENFLNSVGLDTISTQPLLP